MAHTTRRLTALTVSRARNVPGMHADGGGLYLQVTDGGASWIYRFMLNGRAREMGLGPLALYSLQEARGKALEARRLRDAGIDPVDAKRTARVAVQLAGAKAITFKACAAAYIKVHRAGWRNVKHAAQWEATLATYVEPIFGAFTVQAVDTAFVLRVIEPLWTTKPETASRVRGRIESVLDWAKAHGYRTGDNPARWRGHLDKLLPARAKVRKVEHHAALPYEELPKFFAELSARETISAKAMAFTILTAARSGATRLATVAELDVENAVWTVPDEAGRKSGREHRVPLSKAALAQLGPTLHLDNKSGCLFPNAHGKPLSDAAMLKYLQEDMKQPGLTVHGFRSSFKDWAAEQTDFSNEVSEAALSHIVGDKVEAAYRRGDLFEKRRLLMDAWAKFCTSDASPRSRVAPIKHAH